MNKKNIAIISAVVFMVGIGLFVGRSISTPSTYEECIMKSMDGVQSDMAARLKANACRSMFPEKKVYLSDEEVYGKKN